MIRFVEIKGMYIDDTLSFGFYDTKTDKFLEFSGEQYFDSVAEFKEFSQTSEYDIERLLNLIPKNWLET